MKSLSMINLFFFKTDKWPPLNIPPQWRTMTKTLKNYGSHRGAKYLKKVLMGRKAKGDNEPLLLPKNIRVVSAATGQFLFPLTEGLCQARGVFFAP